MSIDLLNNLENNLIILLALIVTKYSGFLFLSFPVTIKPLFIIDLITMRQNSSSVLSLTTKEGLKRKDCMRFGTIALGADVGADYVVCVSHEV